MSVVPAIREEPLCEARHVCKVYPLPDGRPRPVLEDVNLAVRPGEVVALLGPSGCGKSTVLRILAGLVAPTRGEVLYRGRPLRGLNPGVGMVFQSFALYPWMTVAENVEVVLKAARLAAPERRRRVQDTLSRVGLQGFEDAYPRDLSGGMKQRVGIARALSIDPELLFMDEPFSQIDALTAESLRAEVLDIWSATGRNPASVVLVSHDIKEVVFMADRVVVLGTNPGRVLTVVENRLPRPRDYRSPASLALVDRLHEIITGNEMPDVAAEAESPWAFAPLPSATPGEVVGLIEYLDARGGREDLFRIATDTGRDFGRTIAVVKAAELLDLADTPKQLVVLSPDGQRFAAASPAERRAIWRAKLLGMRLFREVQDLLARRQGGPVDAELVQDIIVLNMPFEDFEDMFRTLVRWGQYGELFAYDEDTSTLASFAGPAAAGA